MIARTLCWLASRGIGRHRWTRWHRIKNLALGERNHWSRRCKRKGCNATETKP